MDTFSPDNKDRISAGTRLAKYEIGVLPICSLQGLNDRGDNSPEEELMDGVFDQFAKFERPKTAKRTRRGKKRKAREGKIVAPRKIAYGFKLNPERDGYIVDEESMPTVSVSSRWWPEAPAYRQ
jgi:DNA invertase Pin-like site-specific DNA recombinase